MMEEMTDRGKVRSNQELRNGINNSISDVQGTGGGPAAYGQMKELMGRNELASLQKSQGAEDAIASALAIALAPENKGRVPRVITDYLNRQFGFDGKETGIIDGGIDPSTGEFGFVFGERDAQGNTAYRKQMIPPQIQLGLMEGYPELFGEDAVRSHRAKLLEKFAPAEVDAYSNVARLARERRASRINELKTGVSGGSRSAMRNILRSQGLQGGGGGDIKETVFALTQLQSYLDKANPSMSDEQRQKIQSALDAGFAGLAAKFLPQSAPSNGGTATGGGQEDVGFPEGMKEGDEQEHNGKKYVLGRKNGKPMWILKK